MTVFLIDVSYWQGAITWGRVPSSGVAAMTARATLSTAYVDPYYRRNILGARTAGLVVGAYHFLYPGRGADQAKHFLDTVGSVEGLLCQLDTEPDGIYYPMFPDVVAFTERFWFETNEHTLLQYAPRWYVTGTMGNPHGLAALGPLWNSRYIDPPGIEPPGGYAFVPKSWWTAGYGLRASTAGTERAYTERLQHGMFRPTVEEKFVEAARQGATFVGWPEATILQFTSSAAVNGVTGRCDANAFRGTLAELEAYTRTLPPSDVAGDPMLKRKFEVWTAAKGAHRYDTPGGGQLGPIAEGTVVYTGGETEDGAWRLLAVDTEGRQDWEYAKRSELVPVIQGGDPAYDKEVQDALLRKTRPVMIDSATVTYSDAGGIHNVSLHP